MTVKVDKEGRILLPNAKPGDVFSVEVSDEKILLTRLAFAESKLVRARKVRGIWMGAKGVKIDSREIVAAIHADRETK
jgi:bifunctional DNA-binding transcriptional regulator/antitoxin component of YhaV-PrlF toxin-antitoxin module